ncbi:hypothetical protein [Massilia alkalitolerans]|uniref:hypothetical protein n=1 Tax=Massilia alkalitolerans TaxID=286638 RepID=UPI0012EC361A|nr:hypothetical protein [Massilia alkalitolerans]
MSGRTMPCVTPHLPVAILPAERNNGQALIQKVALKIFNSRQNVFFFGLSVRFLQTHASGNSVDFPIEQTYRNFIDEHPELLLI